jgi:hypothetical protein
MVENEKHAEDLLKTPKPLFFLEVFVVYWQLRLRSSRPGDA